MPEPQLGPEGTIVGGEDGGTLNAIGRALIQMQQGSQSVVTSAGGIPQSQLIFTRASSSDTDTTPPNGNANG